MTEPAPGPGDSGRSLQRWHRIEVLTQQEAEEFARTAQITRHALREYMSAYLVAEATADREIRLLAERFLQVGRLSQAANGTVRARSPKADGAEHFYSFLLDLQTRHVLGYAGPAVSWFDDVHVPLEDLRRRRAEQQLREEELERRRAAHEQQLREEELERRRAAHEQRMKEQQDAAAARRAVALPEPTWPLLPDGCYGQDGNPVAEPAPRRPITEETRIRRVGRGPHVVFHSDALNSPFFRQVPVEHRCEALRRVLDLLLRVPTKGAVTIDGDAITVTGKKVTLTLAPDCAAVRTLNPPRPGNDEPPQYRARHWPKERERRPQKHIPPP